MGMIHVAIVVQVRRASVLRPWYVIFKLGHVYVLPMCLVRRHLIVDQIVAVTLVELVLHIRFAAVLLREHLAHVLLVHLLVQRRLIVEPIIVGLNAGIIMGHVLLVRNVAVPPLARRAHVLPVRQRLAGH